MDESTARDLDAVRAVDVPRAALLLLVLALVLRLAAASVIDLHPLSDGQDSVDYLRHGRSIAAGDGYPPSGLLPGDQPTATRSPLYPLLLAGSFKLPGGESDAARQVQAVVGTVTVGLIGLLAWQVAGRRVALIALGLAAVYPPLIAMGTAILSEVLFVPLVLATLVAAVQHGVSRHPYRWAVVAGALAGAVALSRPNGFFILVPIVLAIWMGRPSGGSRKVRAVALCVLVSLAVVAPWSVRTSMVMDGFVPLGTEGGYVLAGMYDETVRTNPAGTAYWTPPQLLPAHAEKFRRTDTNEAELDHELRSDALRYMADHPGYVVEAFVRNITRQTHLTGTAAAKSEFLHVYGLSGRIFTSCRLAFYAIAILAVAGLATRAARRIPLYIWLVPAIYLSSALTGQLIRYRSVVDPFLILLAACALSTMVGRRQEAAAQASSLDGGR